MDIFGKITNAYKSLFKRMDDAEAMEDGEYDDEYGQMVSLSEMDDDADGEDVSLLRDLNPEMRKFVQTVSEDDTKTTAAAPKIVPVRILSDASVATDVIALLGMVRWAMEKSAASGGDRSYDFRVTCRNRSGSPLLVSIGDIAVNPIPVQDEFQVGN